MNKILYSMMGAAMLLGTTSCSDFLEQTSPSEVDKEFVVSTENTLRGAMYSIYDKWRGDGLSQPLGTIIFLWIC